ncbi:MAG: GH3 auxin-responsive promoter family protein [Bacteroidales bacterium]|nr:GH3 auxin-responsive promoter family protein [Bacteroidales bacterium]MCF8326818.1 GH3 auxin-responsive promoter family protein [Bacteroidales bacterium]
MAVIGEIIKKAIEVADKYLPDTNPVEAQAEVLRELLSTAESTEFGQYYKFKDILSEKNVYRAFSEKIPYHSYDKMYDEWWYKVLKGEKNVTWPGKVDYFAVSSGTTSKKKHIPVTDDMLKSIRRAGIQQIKGVADFDLPAEFFEKEILMFGSSTDLKKVNDHWEGEISGISASQIPFWFEGYYRPGEKISSINDWDKRVEALAKEAPNWDIGSVSGIPSWIELMMKKVIAYHNVETIHDIWPNFQVFTSGGVAFEPYQKSFDRITKFPVTIIDTYLTSEGYLATQTRNNTSAMQLITNNGIFFEFIPFKHENINEDGSVRQDSQPITIEDVEENVEYVLIISTLAGAWRYMIGDTIVFTDKERSEIKITGRTKHYLNVFGAQLSVIQMNKAMQVLENEYDCDIKEFTVAAITTEEKYKHRWYIGINEDISVDNEHFAQKLDEVIQKHNKNYKVARTKALEKIEAHLIPAHLFTEWTEKYKQKGGQVKMPKVMKEEEFKEWEKFVQEQLS